MVLALTALFVSLIFAPAAANAAVTPASSASGQGNGSASASLTVPEGAKRYLAVGVSTLESATVTGVTLRPAGAHAPDRVGQGLLTRRGVDAQGAPNVGTATVTVTLSNGSAVVIGATELHRRRSVLPDHRASTR